MTKKIMRITVSLMAGMLLTLSATGCRAGGSEGESRITLSEDGTVKEHIVEAFEEAYYDVEELKQMILTEAASYNRETGSSSISVERVNAEDDQVTVDMTYAQAADFAAFNDSIFFAGTAAQAQEAGYDLNTVLSAVEDELDTIGISDMLAMEDVKILITDCTEPVTLPGKARYISGNVTTDGRFRTVSLDADSEGPAYIIYK